MHATDTSLLSHVPFIVDAVWAGGLALNATRGTDKVLRVTYNYMYHVGVRVCVFICINNYLLACV